MRISDACASFAQCTAQNRFEFKQNNFEFPDGIGRCEVNVAEWFGISDRENKGMQRRFAAMLQHKGPFLLPGG